MIKKLCKYEFRSVLRTLCPIYLAVIALSIIAAITMNINLGNELYMASTFSPDAIYDLFKMVVIFAYFGVMIAMFVITTIIIIQRFYKGLLCSEGYLMFTLPVKTWELIVSKGIVAFVISIFSGIISCISVISLMIGTVDDPLYIIKFIFTAENWRILFDAFDQMGINFGLFTLEFIILIIISGIASLCQLYVSMAIGHIAGKNRVLMSVVAFIVISVAVGFIEGLWGMGASVSMNNIQNIYEFGSSFHLLFVVDIIFSLIEIGIFFVGTERILTKKLNLE